MENNKYICPICNKKIKENQKIIRNNRKVDEFKRFFHKKCIEDFEKKNVETSNTVKIEMPKEISEIKWYTYPEFAPKQDCQSVFTKTIDGELHFNFYYETGYAESNQCSNWRSVVAWRYGKEGIELEEIPDKFF